MRLDPNSPQRMGEERRYFPDWVPRLSETREELEADHNSYLAGGYAEEFGYRAQPGATRGVPLIDGEPPEQTPEWHEQAFATHPGYPLKPYPVVPEKEQIEIPATRASRTAHERSSREPAGAFIRVTERSYERNRRRLSQRVAGAVTRMMAGILQLTWQLPHRRKVSPPPPPL
ncbi:MAG TPA: hypothetical protein VIL32_02125 [Steroidobacteraceae bacterium]